MDTEHNANLEYHQARLLKGTSYEDCSTIHLMLTRGYIMTEVVQCLLTTLPEMNQKGSKMLPVLASGYSCADGYNTAVEHALNQSTQPPGTPFRPYRYLFTTEDDVLWPPDAMHQLLKAMKATGFDGISGLCWTKQPNGYPMILGDPRNPYTEYWPQVPQIEGVQPARAIPLGCSLFKLDLFRDPRWKKPWFREDCGLDGEPIGRCTPDVYMCHNAGKLGYRFGVLTDLKLRHKDPVTGRTF